MNARHLPAVIGWSLVAVAAVVYWLCARQFDAGRSDFYYLADAFLHGRTWLESAPGPNDVIIIGGRYYVPFAPFPAIAAMPLIALIGPEAADRSEPIINAILAGATVGRRVFLHINNSNPVLIEGSAERRMAEASGWTIGADGMVFTP